MTAVRDLKQEVQWELLGGATGIDDGGGMAWRVPCSDGRMEHGVHAHARLCLAQCQSPPVCARRTGGGSPSGDEGRQALARGWGAGFFGGWWVGGSVSFFCSEALF